MRGNKARSLFLWLCVVALILAGCMADGDKREEETSWTPSEEIPELPAGLDRDSATGIPELNVYDKAEDSLERMDIERYVMGVVAGEMKNDWPVEALKAQSILARTFVLQFCRDRHSKYDGADISTDVTEAQAYDAGSVNDRVRSAVEETRGMAMVWQGTFPHAWFHAHSGGMTELPTVALDYHEEDPPYLKPVQSREPGDAPEDVRHWTASFEEEEVIRACADAGAKVDAIESLTIGEKGASGRAKTLLVNGTEVSAPSFRIQIGANTLKSTLIDSIEVKDHRVVFRGRGFGHGVGMSQWGAYAMAERGDSAEQIIRHYFSDIGIVKLW